MKATLISLGCSKNLVDSEMIVGLLQEAKFTISNDATEADAIIINTCGFIEGSKQEAIDTILEMADQKKESAKLIVTGCLAQRYKKDLEIELPEVETFIGVKDYYKIGKIFNRIFNVNNFSDSIDPLKRIISSNNNVAYLKISEGCSNGCSFCAIPLIRGRLKSRTKEDILAEANKLSQQGIKELVIVSQDTSNYGKDLYSDYSIVELLRDLETNFNFVMIRCLYLYATDITSQFIDLIAESSVIVPYFDIPIQHSSDNVLKAMNRRDTTSGLLNLFNQIKTKIPHAVIRTTIILGFPNEREEDFRHLLEFVEKIKFNHLGAFIYSKEDGTKAEKLEQLSGSDEVKARYDELLSLQQKISQMNNKKFIGNTYKAIVDSYDQKGKFYRLRPYMFAPDDVDGHVIASGINLKVGDIVTVKITNAFMYDLEGEVIF